MAERAGQWDQNCWAHKRQIETSLPAILPHANLNFPPGGSSGSMSKQNPSLPNLDSVDELTKWGNHYCPYTSMVTHDCAALQLPKIAALEMFRKK